MLAVVGTIVLGIAAPCVWMVRPLPSHEELAARFRQRRAAFEALNKRVLERLADENRRGRASGPVSEDEDAGVRFGSALSSEPPASGLPPARPLAVTIEYVTDQRGFGTGSFGAGVAFRAGESPPDGLYGRGKYRPIEGPWFSFEWRAD